MVKKPGSERVEEAKKAGGASTTVAEIITVVEGDKTPHDELMKLPKAQVLRNMAAPENKTRFMVDVDSRTKQGKNIIALMESLCNGDTALIKTVAEILGALAGLVATKRTSR